MTAAQGTRGVRTTAVVLGAEDRALPGVVRTWLAGVVGNVARVDSADDLMARALRARPTVVVLDGREGRLDDAMSAAQRVKRDSFTGIVPTLMLVDAAAQVPGVLDAGADEALPTALPDDEARARLAALLRRSARDTGVHPTTRLPGAWEIEAEIELRIASREPFATCYADLDHFKEYNDRYGYNEGDRVIRMLALLLHDTVKGICGERGFVGHIGGDDFLFIVPLSAMAEVCGTIVETFETLVPYQYRETDRRAGYYFGKDRRGKLHRVPLMSVSIGVVTTERRTFTRAEQVSALASEMKSYAKAQPGSVFSVDRRQDVAIGAAPSTPQSSEESP
ncbi:diguanylate cyclase [Gemmatirosa kalamazoonensis]|uniref:diguanylate cyclase n=1 Tax=Gemmatirosa kalamazoonensis TaxID=861299 RepID=W0RJ06_9BACT|nr:GGDEF domain-containing protein [Gemmatirosa kalamazoonensis]AHG90746.1 diguanylate cyclase [Gemmatirosa kalamazoonensis]